MRKGLQIIIASPPDRKRLVAEIWNESDHVAEINREQGSFAIETYPATSGEPWHLDVDEFVQALLGAKTQLEERS